MMKFLKLLSLPILLFSLTKCASSKFEETPPFKVTEATYTNWVGGVPGVSGTNINITYKADKEILFDSIFYKNNRRKVSYKKVKNETSIMAQFSTSTVNNASDLQMHSNSVEEYGNKPPESKTKVPFDLNDSEVVVSYIENKKTKYHKIKNLKEGKRIFMQ